MAYRLDTQQISHIHVHFADQQVQWGQALSVWLNVPFSFTMHGYDIRDLPIGKEALSYAAKHASKVIAVSTQIKSMLCNLGIPSNKVEIVPCGINPEDFLPKSPGFTGGTLKLVTVARLHPIKSHSTLIRAIAILQKRNVAIELVLVGNGQLRGELEKLTETLGVHRQITFAGACSQDKVKKYLSGAHVHILPSLNEGLGVANLEAMASGLPVIASNVGGIPEVVKHEYNGILIPANDPVALADAIERIAASPELWLKLAERAYQTATTQFNRSVLMTKFLSSIREPYSI